jgi:hypothetical protein
MVSNLVYSNRRVYSSTYRMFTRTCWYHRSQPLLGNEHTNLVTFLCASYFAILSLSTQRQAAGLKNWRKITEQPVTPAGLPVANQTKHLPNASLPCYCPANPRGQSVNKKFHIHPKLSTDHYPCGLSQKRSNAKLVAPGHAVLATCQFTLLGTGISSKIAEYNKTEK